MIPLTTLIKCWEKELADPYGEHYPYTDNLQKATIVYLKQLQKRKERKNENNRFQNCFATI